ncbi:MAG TPA: hypothetical protein PK530_03600 [Anaerolineales bacterium]|nr:hypothetical protein [Anaerolineales bacterium]
MLETILGLTQILVFLFIVCKIFTAIGKACGVSDVKAALGESLSIGSGRFPRQD